MVGLTGDSNVVWFHGGLDNLAILDRDRIALASVVSEETAGVEVNIPGFGEFASGVCQEANATALVCVQALSPCLHAKLEQGSR